MKVGDTLIAGKEFGKIKAMHDESGKPVESAGPSRPVSVLGMNGVKSAGDIFNVLEDEKEMKQINQKTTTSERARSKNDKAYYTG